MISLVKQPVVTLASLDTFTRAYIECALWTEEETLREDAKLHESECIPAQKWDVNIHAISPESLAEIVTDCEAFQTDEETSELLGSAYGLADFDYSAENAGHDFWLTRNGHGAGFWDRGLGSIGQHLSNAAKVYGSSDLYFGDDGKLHIS